MNFQLPQPKDREGFTCCLTNRKRHVSLIFAQKITTNAAPRMQWNSALARFFLMGLCALLPTACSKAPSDEKKAIQAISEPLPPSPTTASDGETVPVHESERVSPELALPSLQETSEKVDASVLERRFVAASNNPKERIAIIDELADLAPGVTLTALNRLYPLERREDVKMEMLAAMGDLDHDSNRDDQLALCLKALAPEQPLKVRYVAVQVLSDLNDPRSHALLVSLKSDKDREIRAAAVQALRDESP